MSVAVGVVSFGLYFWGAGRSFSYDEGNTIGTFVRQGDLMQPFRVAAVFNNHPLFSFAETIVGRLASIDERWMRLLPAVLGAATVALFAWWSGRRYGWRPALAGAVVLATSPLFVVEVRQARGYAVVVFCALVASILLVDDVKTPLGRLCYSGVIAVAVGTHLYALLVVLAHVGYVASRRPVAIRRLAEMVGGVALGAVAYVGLWRAMSDSAHLRGHQYRRNFPLGVAKEVLGREALPMILIIVLLSVAASSLLRRREIVASLALPLLAVLGAWQVARPTDLYPRFLVAMVLPIAAAVAWAVNRHGWLLALALVAALSALVAQHRDFQVEAPVRDAAKFVAGARELGLRPCAIGVLPIGAYTAPPVAFREWNQVADCDLVVQVTRSAAGTIRLLGPMYPHHWEFRDRRAVSTASGKELLRAFDGFGREEPTGVARRLSVPAKSGEVLQRLTHAAGP